MEAIVLAGGLGTRLRQVVADVPKAMAPVAGRPFLEILLTTLAGKGFTRVVLSLGYLSEQIVRHFGDRYADMELVYEIEDTPLGTGGALRAALERCTGEHVFVFNGDTFLDLEVTEVVRQLSRDPGPIIVARDVPDTSRYGRLYVERGRVRGFIEKGVAGPGLINAGCYVLPRRCLDAFTRGQPFSLESDYLAHAMTQQHVGVFVTRGYFIDIGVPDDYARAQTELAGIVK
ncbi:D-glycero-alpha-D-manno-heptose 1-phosphate guanylyltransferase [Ralstonia sp. 25mfcol4.1]|uniref:nucleotidyltransferase family protein n=1 Tax=Ralstonia sp. 25mfcol4.1 TaxID=1761899 RepID=UPI00041A8C15|nr:nucleotidyltransferase family protein [Ralstonia sp. 25mfcol4.1]SDP57161.1 D-glycero-alpha-D-manno-heptose 1-phosphate guanylyltransferase [Ralstonia sp. 25mfcol4.1]